MTNHAIDCGHHTLMELLERLVIWGPLGSGHAVAPPWIATRLQLLVRGIEGSIAIALRETRLDDDVDAKLLCKRCRRLAGACHRARIDRVDRFRTQELGQSARLRVATRVQVGICGSLRHLLPNWQSMAYQNELHLSGRSW